ncbi:hypothetical protein ROHU_026211 [Labeo rohita]|uniref:Uncharacterized protein n=1 Tax=Labeo rohita TaxID=84645 RepID=A0A498MMH7_LABRO|nr:hypothetical protein ROHU_026211 [Labeo rohita]
MKAQLVKDVRTDSSSSGLGLRLQQGGCECEGKECLGKLGPYRSPMPTQTVSCRRRQDVPISISWDRIFISNSFWGEQLQDSGGGAAAWTNRGTPAILFSPSLPYAALSVKFSFAERARCTGSKLNGHDLSPTDPTQVQFIQ